MGELSKATGVSPQTIKAWLHKGVVLGHKKIEAAGGTGNKRSFSFNNVMEFAAASALLDVAFQRDSKTAFQAAHVFAHTGHDKIPNHAGERHPAFPFYEGRTLLCTSGEHTEVIQQVAVKDAFIRIRESLGGPTALVIVDMGEVFDRVVNALGYDPRNEIAAAYQS